AELVEILERSDLPSDLFEKVSDILRTAGDESWTVYRTKRHLSKELIPKESSGWWSDRAAYRHSIRRTARTLSTQNASVRVSRELREQGFTHKRWVSVMDSRVRSTHAEANGQTVPLGESFSVGAYGLRYPGDPQGPDVEIQNCRCVIVGVGKDGEMGTTTLTAAGTEEDEKSPDAGIEPVTSKDEGVGASLPQGWSGPIGMEQTMTGDARLIEADALQWETPILLRSVLSDLGDLDGANVFGTIQETAREEDGRIVGTGTFDLDSEIGREAARHVFEGLTRGVSMDLDDVSFEVRVAEDVLNSMEAMMDGLTDDEDGEEAEAEARAVVDGKVVMMEVNSDDEVHVTKSARIRAATIVAIPAFSQAMIEPVFTLDSVNGDDNETGNGESLEASPAGESYGVLALDGMGLRPEGDWLTARVYRGRGPGSETVAGAPSGLGEFAGSDPRGPDRGSSVQEHPVLQSGAHGAGEGGGEHCTREPGSCFELAGSLWVWAPVHRGVDHLGDAPEAGWFHVPGADVPGLQASNGSGGVSPEKVEGLTLVAGGGPDAPP